MHAIHEPMMEVMGIAGKESGNSKKTAQRRSSNGGIAHDGGKLDAKSRDNSQHAQYSVDDEDE